MSLPLTALPTESFPVVVPNTGIALAPISRLNLSDCGLRIDGGAYQRNVGVDPNPAARAAAWRDRVVLARTTGPRKKLTDRQAETVRAIANDLDYTDVPDALGRSLRSTQRGLQTAYHNLRISVHAAAAVTAFILDGEQPPEAPTPNGTLTEADLQVLALFAGGLRQEDIAARFDCHQSTISRHLSEIGQVLGIDNSIRYTPAAPARAFRLGLLMVGSVADLAWLTYASRIATDHLPNTTPG